MLNFGMLKAMPGDYLLMSNIIHFVFCILVVSYVTVSINNQNNSHSRVMFRRSLLVVLVSLIADMLSYVFDTQTFYGAGLLNHVSMFVTVLSTTLVAVVWHMFFDTIYHLGDTKHRKLTLYMIPTVLIFFGLIINLFTGWFYFTDEYNVYHRGPLYFIDFFLQYIGFVTLIIRVIIFRVSAKNVKTEKHRRVRNSIIWLGVTTLLFGSLQWVAGGYLAFHCFGITAGVLIMFIRFQDDQILQDVLTGLNNRYSLDTYVVDKIKTYQDGTHGNMSLYLIMMDVNDFKRINDRHGHLEGDVALKCVSRCLKQIGESYPQGLFLARYGGDEFSAVFESQTEEEVMLLCEKIKTTLKAHSSEFAYDLTIGVGYAKYLGKVMSMSMFYELADNAMYVDKNGNL